MSSSSTQVIRMDIYEPFHQVSMWEDNFKVDGTLNSIASPMLMMNTRMDNKSECAPHETREPSEDDQETNDKVVPKVLRRLAQNREAARKCRLRKKAYVQQLETSRLKLMQLELEIQKTRKQGQYISSSLDVSYMGSSATINPGISIFEIEYVRWVEEQDRQNEELRNALQSHASDVQLNLLVESSLNHYSNLFRIKADAAKADVFYLISGAWKASVERLFLWIGGSRPSQLLNIIVPQLEALTDPQIVSINNLRLSSQQAEDALSVGLEKLQQSMVHNIQADPLLFGNCGFQMAAALDKGEAIEGFVNQADHLRQQTLLYMSRILSIGQAAQGLLAMGEYFHRLRTLNSLWTARSFSMDFPPPTQTTMTSVLAVVYYGGRIKRDDNDVTFECKSPKSFRINRGITLDALKRNVNDIVVRPRDDRRVCDIHYRYPISWEHVRAEYDVLKLEDNGDVETMFTVFSQYASLGPIELYADLRRSIDQIISACRKPRSVDKIIAMCTDPETSSVTSLTQS